MKTATVKENKTVKVGDWVGFKSDIEQYGKITAIKETSWGSVRLLLENKNCFDGHYIGGDTETSVDAENCWAD